MCVCVYGPSFIDSSLVQLSEFAQLLRKHRHAIPSIWQSSDQILDLFTYHLTEHAMSSSLPSRDCRVTRSSR
jgi:hypothetical protein